MADNLPTSAQRVQNVLSEMGVPLQVVELPESTRSAAEAAQAIGCRIEQIAKSLIFRGAETGEALLVIASGVNRIDEAKLSAIAGEPIVKADAKFVRERTGFAIGGIPPIGHAQPIRTFIDSDLMQLDEIWAAAGTPHAVFRLPSADLPRITGGEVISVKQ
jgi:prolyl-tRNA editing enzyme YbaK/EbsC (Cys-tRNA(Pro) deacylase)